MKLLTPSKAFPVYCITLDVLFCFYTDRYNIAVPMFNVNVNLNINIVCNPHIINIDTKPTISKIDTWLLS